MYPIPSFPWHAIGPDTCGSSICWHKRRLVMKSTRYTSLVMIPSLIGYSRLRCCCRICITRISTTRASGMSHIEHEAIESIILSYPWRGENVCTKRINGWWVWLFVLWWTEHEESKTTKYTHSPCMCSGGCVSFIIPVKKEQEFFSRSEALTNLGQKSATILHTVPCTSFSFVPTSLFSPQVYKGSDVWSLCAPSWWTINDKESSILSLTVSVQLRPFLTFLTAHWCHVAATGWKIWILLAFFDLGICSGGMELFIFWIPSKLEWFRNVRAFVKPQLFCNHPIVSSQSKGGLYSIIISAAKTEGKLQCMSTLCVPQHPSPLRLCGLVAFVVSSKKLHKLHINRREVESPLINTVLPRSKLLAKLGVKLTKGAPLLMI